MRIGVGATALVLVLGVGDAVGQTVAFGGQVRPRFEFREPTSRGTDGFTSMRVRAHLTAQLERDVRVFVQLQDVRLFGEETNTLSDFTADHFDLHQGYIEMRGTGEQALRVRVGRQEAVLGGERLVGPVGWTPQGRAFDGVRAGGRFGAVDVELVGFKIAEATGGTNPADEDFAGLYAVWDLDGAGSLDLYGFYDRLAGIGDTDQGTFGARWHGERSNTRYRVEGSYQLGTRGGADVGAFMVGVRVGRALAGDRATVTLWYDYLSGDADPGDGDVKVFDTLFSTGHKFYGFADLFTNIPLHTGGLGLQDAAVKGTYRVGPDVGLAADLHIFRTATRGSLTSGRLAEELDLTLNYEYAPGFTITTGASYVVAGAGLAELGRLTENMTFAYLMLSALF